MRGDKLVDFKKLLQPVKAATETLPPKPTPQLLNIPNDIQVEIKAPTGDDSIDSALDLASQLLEKFKKQPLH